MADRIDIRTEANKAKQINKVRILERGTSWYQVVRGNFGEVALKRWFG